MSFIDNCFKTFVDKLFIKRSQFIAVEKKTFFLSLPYLGVISLQTRTNLRKSLKDFKDLLPSDLVSGVVYKYTCGRYNSTYYGEIDRHLKVRSGEHIGISPLTFKKAKPSKESAIHDNPLNCNKLPSFEEFTILTHGNNKFYFGIKDSLLIKRDRPILNKSISSTKSFLFHKS